MVFSLFKSIVRIELNLAKVEQYIVAKKKLLRAHLLRFDVAVEKTNIWWLFLIS